MEHCEHPKTESTSCPQCEQPKQAKPRMTPARERAAEQIPTSGIEGMEEELGQEPGGTMKEPGPSRKQS